MGNLTAAKVKSLIDKPGRYSDGDGLILFVRSPGVASWVARVQHNGKRRDYGLGSAKLYKLAEARDRAWEVRRALADGRDPALLWKPPAALLRTFRDAADDYLDKASKAGEKRRKQDKAMLLAHAFPALGKLQVQSVDADRIAECLRPIWTAKPETARQVRSLIVRTLSYTRPDAGDFETALARAVAARLPAQPRSGNFDALPYQDVPAVMDALKGKTGIAALALRMLILCASRSGEIRGATWDEVDFERAVWTIPAERMKMRKPHRVPLSPQALAVLEEAKAIRRAGTDHIFPNGKGAALSDMALTKRLRDMKMECTAHGFRSSFRDWAAEQTSVPDDVAEAALAHAVPDKVVAAYKRTTFDEMRRELMDAWGRFATGQGSAEVVQMEMRANGL
jgi:integrase